eukprot:TRINITY_DN26448_c0_g1_i1.p1 TRINITY_DN26448_c0_g1~~TRINITY_DN26448_c0_g1_i1.p1  ORF type:complete len:358 (+),score=92.65 TRINITY_DN26448_c0_g1_i1:42-1076(+)
MANDKMEMSELPEGDNQDHSNRSPIDTEIAKADLDVDEDEFRNDDDNDDDSTSTEDENRPTPLDEPPRLDSNDVAQAAAEVIAQQQSEEDGKELELLHALQSICRNPRKPHPGLGEAREKLMHVRRVLVHKVHAQSKKRIREPGPQGGQGQSANQQQVRSSSPTFMPSRHDRKKRTRAVERCSSPSHFAVPSSELQRFGPPSIRELPSRRKVDSVLQAVAVMYYSPKEVTSDKQNVLVDQMYDKNIYSTIDCLMSPLRKVDVWDNWTPREIALFESGICSFGKDFVRISKVIQTKNVGDCVDFYYKWKKSAHYQMWKEYGKPVREIPEGRMEQWNALKEKMVGF